MILPSLREYIRIYSNKLTSIDSNDLFDYLFSFSEAFMPKVEDNVIEARKETKECSPENKLGEKRALPRNNLLLYLFVNKKESDFQMFITEFKTELIKLIYQLIIIRWLERQQEYAKLIRLFIQQWVKLGLLKENEELLGIMNYSFSLKQSLTEELPLIPAIQIKYLRSLIKDDKKGISEPPKITGEFTGEKKELYNKIRKDLANKNSKRIAAYLDTYYVS